MKNRSDEGSSQKTKRKVKQNVLKEHYVFLNQYGLFKMKRIFRSQWLMRILAPFLFLKPCICSAESIQVQFEIDERFFWGTIPLVLLIIGITLIINAFFVAASASLDSIRTTQLKSISKTPKLSKLFEDIARRRLYYLSACVLGKNICRLLLLVMAFYPAPTIALMFEKRWEIPMSWELITISGFILSFLVLLVNLIFAEIIPKNYAEDNPIIVIARLGRFIGIGAGILGWSGNLIFSIVGSIERRFPKKEDQDQINAAEEEIITLVESAEETGEIEKEESELLQSVFEFGDLIARQVMTPRVDLYAIEVNSDPYKVVEIIQKSGFSRIPVYENTEDHIIGIVHAKDLLTYSVSSSNGLIGINLREVMRPALYVPENKRVQDLLDELRLQRSQMAVIQDEFGGTAGILTIEDIVEELVGEIVDEYDIEEPEIVANGNGYVVDGRLALDDLNETLGSDFESDEFDSVGGYIFGLFGYHPNENDQIDVASYRFIVTKTDGRRIHKLYITPLQERETIPTQQSG